MIPEYVQKIKDWPVPGSGKEVATFLGFAGYYPYVHPSVICVNEPTERDTESGEVLVK